MPTAFLLCFLLTILAPFASYGANGSESQVTADEVRVLKKKVELLEKSLSSLVVKSYDSNGRVQSFLAESLSLGGYFENSIQSIWGENTSTQTVADAHRMGINVAADLGKRFRFVGQYSAGFNYPLRNEHNNPASGSQILPPQRTYQEVTFGSLLSQGYGEYAFNENWMIQMGMGYTPFGYAFQLREPVLFIRRGGPQLIRTQGIANIIIADPFWKGLHVKGRVLEQVGINLYTTTSLGHDGKMGGGARLFWELDDGMILGASTQTGRQSGVQYWSYGFDAVFDFRYGGFKFEIANNKSSLGEPVSYYFQPYIRLLQRKLTLHLDFDYLKNELGLTTLGSSSVADPYIKWEYGIGFNYQFLPNVKIRMGYILHDYTGVRSLVNTQNRDYQSLNISSGISF